MENSPEKTCEDDGGYWSDSSDCSIEPCQLGCCLIGNQAAFVTQTRCKRLSSVYGLEIDYRTDINNEFTCIASITSQVKGACVYEKDFSTECTFIIKEACQNIGEENASFYEGRLCSDGTLGTDCSMTEKTTCVEGRDEIFFVDSCGNVANVYDASKIKDNNYWSEVYPVSESCGYGDSNADSTSCGNCDYFVGTTCKEFQRGQDKTQPLYGDNICRDLSCEWEGKEYQHGETWCANQEGSDEFLPGSRDFRMVCYNGEVTNEPCADFRQEICIESEVDGFSAAACRVNQWQDCYLQTDKATCENTDRRDCRWVDGIFMPDAPGGEATTMCVPSYAPGFDFWNSEGDAQGICDRSSTQCIVEYEVGLLGGRTCVKNCECLDKEWETSLEGTCLAQGDCGAKVNFVGAQGFQNETYVKIEEYKEDEK